MKFVPEKKTEKKKSEEEKKLNLLTTNRCLNAIERYVEI